MPGGQLGTMIGYLRRIIRVPVDGTRTDRHLLEQFAVFRDEAAFAELVRRHGPMVLNVCWRVLSNVDDAEDAFQATFLVLAGKASAVRWQESAAGWLHEVAHRVAVKARGQSARRRAIERQAREMPRTEAIADATQCDLRRVLDEELSFLPEKYRVPLVLCYLEGKTNEEAAQQLGWTKGTVSGRLARARDLLRGRLARRGLALSAGTLVVALSQNPAEAVLSAVLLDATVKAATLFAAGKASAAGAVSASVAALAEGVLQTMWMTKLKITAALMLALALVGGGGATITYRSPGTELAAAPTEKEAVPRIEQKPADGQTISDPVKVNDMEFQAVTDSVWQIPAAGKQSTISLSLRVTNTGKVGKLFVPWRGEIALKTADGKALTATGSAEVTRIRGLPAPVPLLPGNSLTSPECPFLLGDGQSLRLNWYDVTGGERTFAGLQPGKYLVCLVYKHDAKNADEWGGDVQTAPLAIEIKAPDKQEASNPVKVNDMEFQAVTDAIWPIPAAGEQSTISLGLRVTNTGKVAKHFMPWRGSVALKTADGKVLKPTVYPIYRSRKPPAPVALPSGTTLTNAECPLLIRDGKSFQLKWMGLEGGICTFDGLQPGKYLVSLVYKHDAKNADEWGGEVETASLAIEIKEVRAAADGFGAEVKGLRAKITLARQEFTVGESIDVKYVVKNVSGVEQRLWHCGFWPNHLILVQGTAGKAPPLTPQGQAYLQAFSPGGARDKNVPWPLKPGAEDTTEGAFDLAKLYDLSKPGRYKVQYIYEEKQGGWDGRLPSNEVAFEVAAGDMTDEQILKRAVEVISKEDALAKVTPVQSKNIHLGPWVMRNPLPQYGFFCARLNPGKEIAAPNRRFLAVKRTGEVIDSLNGEKFAQLLAAQDRAKWTDADYRNAAILWVHVIARANEDGWMVLEKPDDFTKITFNMAAVGLGAAKQKEAAKQIIPLQIERKDGQAIVTFYAWHLIGGNLRRWQMEIGPKMAATKQDLGQFGGGGYD